MITFTGQYSNADFGEGIQPRKKGEGEYVTQDFKGKIGKRKVRMLTPKEVKTDIGIVTGVGAGIGLLVSRNNGWKGKLATTAAGAGLYGGAAYLYHKKSKFSKDIDGRSDKGKKRK